MRITILLNYDSAAAHALELLAPNLSNHQLTVFYTNKPNHLKNTPTELAKLAKFENGLLSKNSEVFTKHRAELLNDINELDFERFELSSPDLVISIRHMSILKSAAIAVPRHGVINLHSGLLPSYQGVMATFWAMKNREPEVGATLHYIEDANIDTGAIIAQSREATRFDQSYFWNVLNIYRGGCQKVVDAVDAISRGEKIKANAQVGEANYFTYPNDTDIDEFDGVLFDQNSIY